MPPAREGIPLRLEVRAEGDRQLWKRDFDGFEMKTEQLLEADGRMAERRGPFELLFRVTAEDGGVVYRPVGLRFGLGGLRLRVPWRFGPRVHAGAWSEKGDAAEMQVHVAISWPLLGTSVTYAGTLLPYR